MARENPGSRAGGLRASTVVLWSAAAALAWGAADVAQLSVAIGGEPVLRLAAVTASLYAILGLLSGLIVTVVVGRLLPPSLATTASLAGLALAGWGVVVAGTYINVVYLPSLGSPVSIAGNAIVAGAGVGLWLLIARVPLMRRSAESRAAAASLGVLAILATLLIARGRGEAGPVSAAGGASDKPSVFVIAIDTLRYDRTGLAGGRASSLTPNLDGLASGGTAFKRAYAQASWTKPSVASLFTSLYPSTHGANFRRDRLASGPTTIAELFKRNGYRTAVFSSNPWVAPAFGFDRGVDFFFQSERESFSRLVMLLRSLHAADRVLPGNVLNDVIRDLQSLYGLRGLHATNCERDVTIVDSFSEWLDAAPAQPAFAYFHLMSPHIPYEPPGIPVAFARGDQVALLQKTSALPPGRRKLLVALYDATVRHADEILGRLLRVLRERGMFDRSIVVVTADHGEEFHEHGRWGHGKSLYDEVLRVPLVLHGPGVPAAVRRQGPVMLVDVVPTLAKLTYAEIEPSWEGRALFETAGRGADSGGRNGPWKDRTAYAELLREGGLQSYMVFRDGRKYLEASGGLGSKLRAELYDLDKDPGEQTPLTGSALVVWHERLAAMQKAARSKQFASKQVVLDAAAREKLRALGYLN